MCLEASIFMKFRIQACSAETGTGTWGKENVGVQNLWDVIFIGCNKS